MFNRFKERLKGFKEAVSAKIQEKGEAQAEPPEAEAIGGEPERTSGVPEAAVARPVSQNNEAKTKQSFTSRAKSLIFEQEVVLDEKDLKGPLWDLEMALLESDVALPVAETIVGSVKDDLVGKKKKIRADTGEIVEDALRKALHQVLSENLFDVDLFIRDADKPVKIVFVGVNGTGKTTSIAKVARYLKDQGYSVVLAAGDTFRAGAVEQIEVHANNLEMKLVKHKDGKDPAAVIFDAVEYARAHHKDVILADTAGRLHTNVNLMDQMKKIVRVVKPDLLIFVDEAIAGNDAVERARLFNEAVPIDGTILTKTDADAKGGAAISISHVTGKPVLFLGVGQNYPDLVKFEPEWLLERLLGP
ncbi:MAG: Signal recognition particle receptor FtsY [Methanothrix sp.]|nr:MAG: Signal recognition particle receptor FtsY [Methanothrix sp.]